MGAAFRDPRGDPYPLVLSQQKTKLSVSQFLLIASQLLVARNLDVSITICSNNGSPVPGISFLGKDLKRMGEE